MTTWRDRAEELISNSETIRAEQVALSDEAWRVLTWHTARHVMRDVAAVDPEMDGWIVETYEFDTPGYAETSAAEAAVGYSLT